MTSNLSGQSWTGIRLGLSRRPVELWLRVFLDYGKALFFKNTQTIDHERRKGTLPHLPGKCYTMAL